MGNVARIGGLGERLELPQWGSGRFYGKFWIFEQSND